jgi:hypothetical protein
MQVMLLKGASPLADVTIQDVYGSAVGFEDSSGEVELSIRKVSRMHNVRVRAQPMNTVVLWWFFLQCIVRDLRKEATFKLVFDIWHERAASASHDVVQDVLAGVPDASTMSMNDDTGVDPALLRELLGSAALASLPASKAASQSFRLRSTAPSQLHGSFADRGATDARPPILSPSRASVTQAPSMHGVSAIDAVKRIEAGLHFESVLDRHRGVAVEFPEDSREAKSLLMVGIDMNVDAWDTIGYSLPAAQLWKSSVHVVLHSELSGERDDLLGTIVPEPTLTSSAAETSISVFRVRVRSSLLVFACATLLVAVTERCRPCRCRLD